MVHSNTFTAKDIDPTNRFLTGRDSSTKNEAKRKEAVWDLFQSETAFLLDHLMVLKHVCKLFDCFSVLWDIHIIGDLLFLRNEFRYLYTTFFKKYLYIILEFLTSQIVLRGLNSYLFVVGGGGYQR